EPAAVLAPHYRVAQQLRVELLLAANEIVEQDLAVVVEPEAPVRLAAFGNGRVGRLALVDRRQAPPEQHLAAKLELFGSLIAGVDPARFLQLGKFALVKIEPLGLPDH